MGAMAQESVVLVLVTTFSHNPYMSTNTGDEREQQNPGVFQKLLELSFIEHSTDGIQRTARIQPLQK